MRQTVIIKDFPIHFTNINKEMDLRGHSHFALVALYYGHEGTGFPAFENTYADIQKELQELTAKPIKGTNEEFLRIIFKHFRELDYKKFNWKYKTNSWLTAAKLSVRGVPDSLGHANGFTDYFVEE